MGCSVTRGWTEGLPVRPARAAMATLGARATLKLFHGSKLGCLPAAPQPAAPTAVRPRPISPALTPIRKLEELLKYVIKLEFNRPGNLWPGAAGITVRLAVCRAVLKDKLKKRYRGSKHYRLGKVVGNVNDLQAANLLGRLDLDPAGNGMRSTTRPCSRTPRCTPGDSRRPTSTAMRGQSPEISGIGLMPPWPGPRRRERWTHRPRQYRCRLPGWHAAPRACRATVMRPLDPWLRATATSRSARVHRMRVQRLLSVAILQVPSQGARTIDKMRIADRPDAFSKATEAGAEPGAGRVTRIGISLSSTF